MNMSSNGKGGFVLLADASRNCDESMYDDDQSLLYEYVVSVLVEPSAWLYVLLVLVSFHWNIATDRSNFNKDGGTVSLFDEKVVALIELVLVVLFVTVEFKTTSFDVSDDTPKSGSVSIAVVLRSPNVWISLLSYDVGRSIPVKLLKSSSTKFFLPSSKSRARLTVRPSLKIRSPMLPKNNKNPMHMPVHASFILEPYDCVVVSVKSLSCSSAATSSSAGGAASAMVKKVLDLTVERVQ